MEEGYCRRWVQNRLAAICDLTFVNMRRLL
jgi:hypothetical protein